MAGIPDILGMAPVRPTAVLIHPLPKLDLSDLGRYASRVSTVFNQRSVYPDDGDRWEERISSHVRNFIKNSFDPDKCYVVLGGDPIMSAAFHAGLAAQGVLQYDVLRYDNLEQKYWPFRINFR